MSVQALFSAAQAAAADAHTMGALGMLSPVLMERASLCVAQEVQDLAQGGEVVCLVGPGNNGGDGLAVARILAGRGLTTHAWLVTESRNEAAQSQLVLARSHGVRVHEGTDALPSAAVWVDAMLGTGATGAPRGPVAQAIAWVSSRPGPKVAVDVPSGVAVDTGEVATAAFRADLTVTFVCSKPGLHVTPGRDFAGQVVVADIGIRPPPGGGVAAHLLCAESVATMLTGRPRESPHKGGRGHVAVLGGGPDTPGAAVLAGVGAMRSGAGLCTLVGQGAGSDRPELMRAPLTDPVVPRADVLVVGPGLTAPPPAPALETLFRDDPRPAVWDASALDQVPLRAALAGPRVITPHPGEAARILSRAEPEAGWSSASVQARRVEAAIALQRHTGAIVVLKGPGTLVLSGERIAVALEGGSTLATAGSGDVLAGCIGGLLAQGLGPRAAAEVGVSVHGRTSELAGRIPLALELADALPEAIAALEAGIPGRNAPRTRQG